MIWLMAISILAFLILAQLLILIVIRCDVRKLKTKNQKIVMLETTLDKQIADLQTEVANQTAVEQSALKLIQGIPGLIAATIASAQAAGATTAQLQAISDLQDKLAANDAELSAAVTANTPAAPTT